MPASTAAATRVEVRFRDEATRNAAREALASQLSELVLTDAGDGADLTLVGTLRPEALKNTVEDARPAEHHHAVQAGQ